MGITLAHLQYSDGADRRLIAQAVLPTQRGDFQANGSWKPFIQISSKVTATQSFVNGTAGVARGAKGGPFSFFFPESPLFQPHPVDPLTGLTSVASLLSGSIATSKAMQAVNRLGLTGNREERNMAYFNLSSALLRTGSGALFLVDRVSRLVAFIKRNPLTSKIIKVVGKITKVIRPIIYGLALINTTRRIYTTYKLNRDMQKSEHRALFIQKKLNPDLSDLQALSNTEREQLLQEALFYQREALKQQFTFAQIDPPESDDAYDRLLIKIYGVERLQMDLLALRGREELKSIGDKQIIQLIELEQSSGQRLNPDQLEALASRVDEVASSKIDKFQKIFVPLFRFGITLALLVVTHQMALFCLSTAFLGLKLLELVGCKPLGLKSKLMQFIEAMKKGGGEKHDKKMLGLHLLTLVVITGLSIGLTLAFPGLFPAWALLTAAPILLAWFGANLYALICYEKHEKERIEKAPTFANFSRYEELEKSAEKVDQVFQKIIKDNPDMQTLYARYPDKREAREEVLKIAKVVEEGKIAARRQEMRYALQHFYDKEPI